MLDASTASAADEQAVTEAQQKHSRHHAGILRLLKQPLCEGRLQDLLATTVRILALLSLVLVGAELSEGSTHPKGRSHFKSAFSEALPLDNPYAKQRFTTTL